MIRDEIEKMINEVLAFTAPELIAWKILTKLSEYDVLIYQGEFHDVIEADFVDGNDECDTYNVYVVPND